MWAKLQGRAGHRRRSRGFTLIELMVVVAIVAILTTVAIASYDFATTKTRRAAATGCLSEAAQFMERFRTTNMRYDQTPAGAAVSIPACSTDVTAHYTLGFAAAEPTATTFALQAVPQGRQASSDSRCGTLTLNHSGLRGAGDNTEETIRRCW